MWHWQQFYVSGVPETMECFFHQNQKLKILELNPCLTCGRVGWYGNGMADLFFRKNWKDGGQQALVCGQKAFREGWWIFNQLHGLTHVGATITFEDRHSLRRQLLFGVLHFVVTAASSFVSQVCSFPLSSLFLTSSQLPPSPRVHHDFFCLLCFFLFLRISLFFSFFFFLFSFFFKSTQKL